MYSDNNVGFLEKNKELIFYKYSNSELMADISNFINGNGRLYKVLNHFFEEEMYKCKGGRGSLSPIQLLENNTLVEEVLTFTRSKPKFYVGNDISNIKSFFRNAGRKAQKVANFPVREALGMYEKYTQVGHNIYDPSCGFGSRLSACILSGRNYYGTDPNQTLFKKLNECYDFYSNNCGLFNIGNINIFNQGSETFIYSLENNIDFCFTSPPYFDLEDYGSEESQSIVKFKGYDNWVNGFVIPTVKNCYKYTKIGGHIAINIKNITSGKKYKLYNDFFNALNSIKGLDYIETLDIKQSSKREYKGKHFTGVTGDMGQKEPVMIFKKIS